MTPRLKLIVLAAAFAALAMAAGGMLFSTLMAYDDEGYILYSYKAFAEHGGLYGTVFSQYGPFPYAVTSLLHLAGMPFTHDAGRSVVLVEWCLCGLLGAAIVWRSTRSLAFTLFGMCATFAVLWVMSDEPNHPGNLIAFTVALMAYLAIRVEKPGAAFALVGAGSAALVLTKVNVGGLACISAFCAMALSTRWGALRSLVVAGLAGLLALVPFALMKALLGTPWVREYAILSALGGVSAVIAASRGSAQVFAWKDWRNAILAGLAAAAAIVAFMLVRHTSVRDLLDGIILEPIHHPVRYSFSYPWSKQTFALAGLSFGLFAASWAIAGTRAAAVLPKAIALLRLVAFAGLTIPFVTYPDYLPDRLMFPYVMPALWLFLWPIRPAEPRIALGRCYLGLLAWGQYLHAYPVPGSQVAWGLFLSIAIGAVGTWEAAELLSGELKGHGRALARGAVAVAALAPAWVSGRGMLSIAARYPKSETIQLPGAEAIRITDATTGSYHVLTMNAKSYGDLLFEYPGMYSYNLWTGLPTPTLANVTHWWSLLSKGQQEEVIAQLRAHPRSCIIRQNDILRLLEKESIGTESPITTFLRSEYETAFDVDGYTFLVRKGRKISPLGFFELYRNTSNHTSLVRLRLDAGEGTTFTSLSMELADALAPRATPIDGRIVVTPIDESGAPGGTAHGMSFPIHLKGRVSVDVYLPRDLPVPSLKQTIVVGRDPTGIRTEVFRALP